MSIVEAIQDRLGFFLSAIKWAVGLIFSDRNLDKSVVVSIAPIEEAVRLDCSGKTVAVWVRIYNFSPFKLKVSRFVLRFNYAGFSIQMMPDNQESIPAFTDGGVYVRTNLDVDQCRSAAACNDRSTIEYNASFSSKMISIEKRGYLEQFPFSKVNAQVLLK